MADFVELQEEREHKQLEQIGAAWSKFNAGQLSYDDTQALIKAAEAVCNDEIEAAYKASDTKEQSR